MVLERVEHLHEGLSDLGLDAERGVGGLGVAAAGGAVLGGRGSGLGVGFPGGCWGREVSDGCTWVSTQDLEVGWYVLEGWGLWEMRFASMIHIFKIRSSTT